MAVRRRGLRLLLLAAVTLPAIATPGRANQPPRPSHFDLVHRFSERVHGRMICPKLAPESEVFGDVVVRFTNATHFSVHASKALGPRFAACVKKAVQGSIAEGDSYPQDEYEGLGYPRARTLQYRFGTPRPNLPEPARLLPAWKAAAHGRAALRAMLPADVAVTNDGCLQPDGNAIRAGVDLWIEKWTTPTVFKWWTLFLPDSAPRFIEPNLLVVTRASDGYCLLPLDAAREHEARKYIDDAGACWQGTTAEVLRAPRVAFPSDRRYRSVSIARDRACAVDAAGAMICCGSPRPQAPPSGRYKSVSVGRVYACALRTDDSVVCWSDPAVPVLAPFQDRYTEVVAGEATVCARRRNGWFECRGRELDVSGDVRQVSLGADGTCVLRRNGTLACAGYGDQAAAPTSAVAVDRNHVTCVLVDGGEVLCPQTGHDGPWGSVSRERFKAIAATSWGGCGRRADDTIGCWGRVPGAVPPGRFTALDSGDSHICGIRDDGRIVCWGERSNGFFWTDFE
jgi:hypothetical protein